MRIKGYWKDYLYEGYHLGFDKPRFLKTAKIWRIVIHLGHYRYQWHISLNKDK